MSLGTTSSSAISSPTVAEDRQRGWSRVIDRKMQSVEYIAPDQTRLHNRNEVVNYFRLKHSCSANEAQYEDLVTSCFNFDPSAESIELVDNLSLLSALQPAGSLVSSVVVPNGLTVSSAGTAESHGAASVEPTSSSFEEPSPAKHPRQTPTECSETLSSEVSGSKLTPSSADGSSPAIIQETSSFSVLTTGSLSTAVPTTGCDNSKNPQTSDTIQSSTSDHLSDICRDAFVPSPAFLLGNGISNPVSSNSSSSFLAKMTTETVTTGSFGVASSVPSVVPTVIPPSLVNPGSLGSVTLGDPTSALLQTPSESVTSNPALDQLLLQARQQQQHQHQLANYIAALSSKLVTSPQYPHLSNLSPSLVSMLFGSQAQSGNSTLLPIQNAWPDISSGLLPVQLQPQNPFVAAVQQQLALANALQRQAPLIEMTQPTLINQAAQLQAYLAALQCQLPHVSQ